MSGFNNLTVLDHPLIQHKVTRLREAATSSAEFRTLTSEIAMLMVFEATRDLPIEPIDIDTPLERMTGARVSGKKLTLVPVLRAGLGMVDGITQLIPQARVGHIGLFRDHDTLQPVPYYFKIPPHAAQRSFYVLDPMLATGGSAAHAIAELKKHHARDIRLLCIVAAPEGVQHLLETHPDVSVWAAALDRELNESGYIVPGLGDAGDRLFGTR